MFEVQTKQVTKRCVFALLRALLLISMLRYAINLHSHDNVAVSVVDNLIVVHNLGSKVSLYWLLNVPNRL